MVKVLDLLLRGPVPHKLYDRYVCLGVQPWQALPPASADEPLCFLLPLSDGMQKHTLEDDGLVGPLDTPSGVFFEEQLGIKQTFCLSNGLRLVQFVSIVQLK